MRKLALLTLLVLLASTAHAAYYADSIEALGYNATFSGIHLGSGSTDNYLSTSPTGTGNATLYIGNARILTEGASLNPAGGWFDSGSAIALEDNADNVGIGIATPSLGQIAVGTPKLHVDSAGSTGTFYPVARFRAGADADNTGAAIIINHGNDRGLYLAGGRDAGDTAVGIVGLVGTGGQLGEVITLRSAGGAPGSANVGIGVRAPLADLHLNGTSLRIDRDSTSYGGYLDYYTQGTQRWRLAGGASSGQHDFQFLDATSASRLTIQQDGDVGLSNPAPDFTLEVGDAGGSLNTNFDIVAGTLSGATGIAASSGQRALYLYSSDTTLKLDAYDYNISSPEDFQIGGNGGTVTIDAPLTIDTADSTQPLQITRIGSATQALRITVDDSYVNLFSEQDEDDTASRGGFRFYMDDDGSQTPYFTINHKSGNELFRLDSTGSITLDGTVDGYDISAYGPYFISSAGTNGQVWKSDGSGAGYWATDNVGLTSESDTLDSVTGRGSSTANSITVGAATINGNLLLSDYTRTDYGGVRTFENVAQYYNGNTVSTGTIIIKIGSTPNAMLDADISVQGYGGVNTYHVRGYTYTGSSNWHDPKATCVSSGRGSCSVRFGKLTATNERVIMLGDTSTSWGSYPHVAVTRVSRGYPGSGDIGDWSISIVTDESPYTVGSSPKVNDGLSADLLDGQDGSYYLDDTTLSEAQVEGFVFDTDNTGFMQTSGGITVGAAPGGTAGAGDITVEGEIRVGSSANYLYLSEGGINRAGTADLILSESNVVVGNLAGSATLTIEADTDNSVETDHAQLILSQDGGAVTGTLGFLDGTNQLTLRNNYADNLNLEGSNVVITIG